MQSFQELHEIMQLEYSVEDQQIIGCPSLEQVDVMSVERARFWF